MGNSLSLGKEKTSAFEQYHEIMRRPRQSQKAPGEAMVTVIDRFLEWLEKNRAPDTCAWYQAQLQLFAQCYPSCESGNCGPSTSRSGSTATRWSPGRNGTSPGRSSAA